MKLCWFHLMPYTDLPEDFTQRHESVWVDIDPALFDPGKAHGMYNDFLDELEFADAMGFDGICVNEHHANGYGLMPSPNLMAAALARRTRNAALIVMGNSIALYNPPIRVAEEFAMLDCISGGRLVAGFPVGSPMDTCYAYGQNPSMLRDRYLEAHDLILRSWTSREPFMFDGRFNKLRYVNVWPRPLQQPHPPIWIPGGGSVETWAWCAEKEYVYSYLSYFGYKAGERTMKGFWSEMKRLGKDANPFRAGFLQFVGVAESREEALRLYRGPAEYFYGRCLHVSPRWAEPPGYMTEASLRRMLANPPPLPSDLTFEQADALGYIIHGSPATVRDRLRVFSDELRAGIVCSGMNGGSHEATLEMMQMFAEEVMPHFRAEPGIGETADVGP